MTRARNAGLIQVRLDRKTLAQLDAYRAEVRQTTGRTNQRAAVIAEMVRNALCGYVPAPKLAERVARLEETVDAMFAATLKLAGELE